MRLSELIRQRSDALLARCRQHLATAGLSDAQLAPLRLEERLPCLLEALAVGLETEGGDGRRWAPLLALSRRLPPDGEATPGEPALVALGAALHASILAEAEAAGLPPSWRELRGLARGLHLSVEAAVGHLARLRAEAWRRQTAELDTILESIPDAVYVGSLGGMWRTNRRARELLGFSSPEQLRQPLATLDSLVRTRRADGAPLPLEEEPFVRALHGEHTVGQLRMRNLRTGQELVLRAAAAPLREDGEVRGAVAILSDVTAQEEAARAREKEHVLLRQMLESLSDAFVSLAPDWRLTFANAAAARLLRRPREALLGQTLWEVLPELVGTPLEAELHRARREGQPRALCHRAAPEGRWFDVSVLPFPNGLSLLMHDITERQQREQERERQLQEARARHASAEEALDALRRGEALQQQVTGIVGHDLRTPLSAISLTAQQLLRQEGVPPSVRQRLQRITSSTERMARMVGELLDFTRARLAGGIPLERREVEVCAVVRRVVEELEVGAPGRLVLTCATHPVWGLLDAERLAQVVSNLVGNALQHGTPLAPVRVAVQQEGQEVHLSVHNEGPPIPPSVRPHLFEPFRRGASGESGGLGLGLYIACQVVCAHGGTLSVTSTDAEGTTFLVRLPLVPPPTLH